MSEISELYLILFSILFDCHFGIKVYRMDIARNICVRETYSEIAPFFNKNVVSVVPPMNSFKHAVDAADVRSSNSYGSQSMFKHRNSLPNVCLMDVLDEKTQSLQVLNVSRKLDSNSHVDHQKTYEELQSDVAVPRYVKTTFSQQNALPAQTSTSLTTMSRDATPYQNDSRVPYFTDAEGQRDDGFINGRLEIRVIPKGFIKTLLFYNHLFNLNFTVTF